MGRLTPIWTIVCPRHGCVLPAGDRVYAVAASGFAEGRLAQQVEGGTAVFRREGEYWTVEHGASALRLRDSKGLGYLATLFANPEVEMAAADLVGGISSGAGDAGEMLDAAAKNAYRQRLEELEADLEEAESWGDPERAAAAREELDFLSRELASAVGLGGRTRKAASGSERARVNVTRAIRSALKRIEENDPDLGRRLRQAYPRTGP